MKNRPDRRAPQPREIPLDHLRPGARPPQPDQGGQDHGPAAESGSSVGSSAEPARTVTPGTGDADAARGKATKSPADVGTRDHLQGAGQGPK